MRSATYSNFGKPEDVLTLQDTPMPEPEPNEVRIKTLLSSIHNHDLIMIQGEYGEKPDLPAVGGSEAVGTIDALGDEVEGLKKGQRVVVSGAQGTWADYFKAPADKVIPLPDAINDELAAQLIAMPMSALMLIEFLELQPGQWLIHNGANGAVGMSLAQLASERGINSINVVRSEDSKQELVDLGITENTVKTEDDDWQQQVKDILKQATGNPSIRGAVDAVGGQPGGELLSLVGKDGVMASLGGMTGKPLTLNPNDLIFKQTQVKGFWGAVQMKEATPETLQRLTAELIDRAATGKLKLPTGGIYPLEDIKKAVSEEVQSDKKGKILLKP